MERSANTKFLLLQINDALFPIGGYSHSYGLETEIQTGAVRDADTAKTYLQHKLWYSVLFSELLPAKLAYQYALQGDLPRIQRLDRILFASKVPAETRSASIKLGSRFLKTVGQFETACQDDIFSRYRSLPGGQNHACAYGVFCCSCGITLPDAAAAFLYAQAAAMVTNCVKTIPLSQTVGQGLLFDCHPVMVGLLARLPELGEQDLCLSAPGFDLACMQHERLYSRLYMS